MKFRNFKIRTRLVVSMMLLIVTLVTVILLTTYKCQQIT